jgi:Fe-S-cluster-containing dehydrogenase component
MIAYLLLVNPKVCDGCKACEVFCRKENNLPEGLWRVRVITLDPEKVEEKLPHAALPSVDQRWGIPQKTFVRVSCMHCEDPPCLPACPAEALVKRADGIVVVDEKKCTGCKLCVEATTPETELCRVSVLYGLGRVPKE